MELYNSVAIYEPPRRRRFKSGEDETVESKVCQSAFHACAMIEEVV